MKNQEKYKKLFRQEASRLIGNLAGNLLDLETDPSLLGKISHDLHTLKGSARLVGMSDVGELAHALEDFSLPGTACAQAEPDAVDLALETLDAMEGLIGLGKPTPSPAEFRELLGRLKQAGTGPKDSEAAARVPETTADENSIPLEASVSVDAPREPLLVSVEELDQLMNLSGELLVQQHRMAARFDQGRSILKLIQKMRPQQTDPEFGPLQEAMGRFTRDLEEDLVEARFIFSEVRERTASVRMQPFSTIATPLERQARSDARRLGKKLSVRVRGGHLLLDRGILEYLRPVLVHTVTNSITHGIEPEDRRTALGKPSEGTIRLQARVDGNRILITVEDDGAGLDPTLLKSAAIRKRLVSEEDANEMEDAEALHLIFTPGFSTAKVVTDMAGRGVGMDAVRANVERLRGQITVESERNRSTRITLALPASIGVVHALLVEVAGQVLAIPMEAIASSSHSSSEESPITGPTLAHLLGWEETVSEGRDWWIELKDGAERAFVRVDRVRKDFEIVLKHPGRLLAHHPYLAGATILPSGEVGLVLNSARLLREAVRKDPSCRVAPPAVKRGKITIADDSPVARHLLRETLETLGYEVREAQDGQAALALLAEALPDALISDYEMPHMDGLELLGAVREKYPDLPVVLLSSCAEEIRSQGLSLGAKRVVLKGDPNFLEVLQELENLHQSASDQAASSGTFEDPTKPGTQAEENPCPQN